jgi:hypothetical protein
VGERFRVVWPSIHLLQFDKVLVRCGVEADAFEQVELQFNAHHCLTGNAAQGKHLTASLAYASNVLGIRAERFSGLHGLSQHHSSRLVTEWIGHFGRRVWDEHEFRLRVALHARKQSAGDGDRCKRRAVTIADAAFALHQKAANIAEQITGGLLLMGLALGKELWGQTCGQVPISEAKTHRSREAFGGRESIEPARLKRPGVSRGLVDGGFSAVI